MMSHYLVHWDGYQSNLQAACERQFLAENFVDVTLAVEAGLIKCHRVVLSAASSYFQQLLSQHTTCSHPIIFMRDMQYWEVIALVDFMYRGEVTVEADKLEPLMKAAQTLQIHGLSACLRACLQRNTSQQDEEGDDSQESSGGGAEEIVIKKEKGEVSRLCEFNSEVELRPISPPELTRLARPPRLLDHTASQRNVVEDEIEFFEEKSELSPVDIEPVIQIQSVFSEQSTSQEKTESSDNCIEIEDPGPSQPDQNFRQFLLVSPLQGVQPRPQVDQNYRLSLQDPPLYKKYSPSVLEQALQDLHTGRFRSIRACARHHGIPMTTLRYRAKVHPKRPHWLDVHPKRLQE